jgi:hypothetical protein
MRYNASSTESIMEKRSAIHAVYAESLVFESNFGLAAVPATDSSDETSKRARPIPTSSAAVVALESVGTSDTTTSPVIH